MTTVVDASVALAWLQDEPGADEAEPLLMEGLIGTVTRADAEIAAGLWQRGTPLSLGDRLCMALGVREGLPVATTDVAWSTVENGPEVLLVR